MEITQGLCDRIAKIRKDHPAKLTRKEFGEMIGVSGETIQNFEVFGRAKNINDAVAAHICDVFGVNKQWLLTGEGDPYRAGIIPELTRVLRNNPALEALLASMLDKMDHEDWEALNRVVAKAMKKEQP